MNVPINEVVKPMDVVQSTSGQRYRMQ